MTTSDNPVPDAHYLSLLIAHPIFTIPEVVILASRLDNERRRQSHPDCVIRPEPRLSVARPVVFRRSELARNWSN